MGSLINRFAEQVARDAVRDYFKGDKFRDLVRLNVRWSLQGYAPGYLPKHRTAFTQTVADRIHDKAREPVYLFGRRIWRKRMAMDQCAIEAERIVTDFLRDEGIPFGAPGYCWGNGIDLADEDMSYWEGCP